MASATAQKNRVFLGKLPIGNIPCVVGTVLSSKFNPAAKENLKCDVVELRLDRMPDLEDWLRRGLTSESFGKPVIVTVRLESEGGAWSATDEERLPLYQVALKNLAAVDVELKSKIVKQVCAMAKRRRKCCIVSFHDFKKTPRLSELRRIAQTAQRLGSVVKIVTMLQTKADVDTLQRLLTRQWKKPVCVMGMGDLGKETRLLFPTLGSCLTYGYLDKPAAPGQLSAVKLVERLSKLIPGYAKQRRAFAN